MTKPDDLMELALHHERRAEHWKSAFYESARWYQFLDYALGVPSVFLATGILGFAFYGVDRPNAPLWTQYTIATLAVVQGVLSAIQMYVRPGPLSESYRRSAADFGTTQRMWLAMRERLLLGIVPTQEEFDRIYEASNQASREAKQLPSHIRRKFGSGKSNSTLPFEESSSSI